MRRSLVVFGLAVVAAASLAGSALAKEGGVELGSTPTGKGPGEPWTTSLTLIDGTPGLLAQAKPGVRIRSLATGETRDFAAKPTDKPGVYTVRVTFPSPGRWAYQAYDGVTGRSYEFPPVTIAAPVAAPKAPGGSSGDGFPVWALVGGLAGLLAAGGAAFAIRRQRFGLSH
jgi:hypothetical protein